MNIEEIKATFLKLMKVVSFPILEFPSHVHMDLLKIFDGKFFLEFDPDIFLALSEECQTYIQSCVQGKITDTYDHFVMKFTLKKYANEGRYDDISKVSKLLSKSDLRYMACDYLIGGNLQALEALNVDLVPDYQLDVEKQYLTAAVCSKSPATEQYLIKKGYDIGGFNYFSVFTCRPDVIIRLINLGLDPNVNVEASVDDEEKSYEPLLTHHLKNFRSRDNRKVVHAIVSHPNFTIPEDLPSNLRKTLKDHFGI